MVTLTRKEIRYFFAKRVWSRPLDWDVIDAENITDSRRHELSIWINGYLHARPGALSQGGTHIHTRDTLMSR